MRWVRVPQIYTKPDSLTSWLLFASFYAIKFTNNRLLLVPSRFPIIPDWIDQLSFNWLEIIAHNLIILTGNTNWFLMDRNMRITWKKWSIAISRSFLFKTDERVHQHDLCHVNVFFSLGAHFRQDLRILWMDTINKEIFTDNEKDRFPSTENK